MHAGFGCLLADTGTGRNDRLSGADRMSASRCGPHGRHCIRPAATGLMGGRLADTRSAVGGDRREKGGANGMIGEGNCADRRLVTRGAGRVAGPNLRATEEQERTLAQPDR